MELKTLVNGLQHIGLPTNDMDKTVAFYESLGFEIEYKTMDGKVRVVFLRLANVVIETYENHQATMAYGALEHIAFDVVDIEATYSTIHKLGYHELEAGIQFLPFWENGVKFFTIEGPNKEKLEFSQML